MLGVPSQPAAIMATAASRRWRACTWAFVAVDEWHSPFKEMNQEPAKLLENARKGRALRPSSASVQGSGTVDIVQSVTVSETLASTVRENWADWADSW